jgi:glycosyltransferase involved in cell wall biosynthesis
MLSIEQKAPLIESGGVDFAPIRIVEVEIGQPLPALSAIDDKTNRHYQRALCVVRMHTQPLGAVELQLGENGVIAEEYTQCIWSALHEQINAHLQQDGLPCVSALGTMGLPCPATPACMAKRERFLAHAPFVSVIVSTRDRPERVQVCISALLSLRYPQYEVIIVDNAPSTSATADFIQQTFHDEPRVRYMRENRPGLSWARNCGILAARGEILAFTDDDVVVDPDWLIELIRGFWLADNVACVSGLILPLELETPAQFWLEEFYGSSWSSRWFARTSYDIKEHRPKSFMYPYTPGLFGAGANTAFTAAFLRSVGGFDPALGAGSRVAGEDYAAFLQVITQGHTVVYEPAALVYHQHRRDYLSLRKQIYHYGTGATGYLTKIILDNPRLLFDFVSKLPYCTFCLLRAMLSKSSEKSTCYPKELIRLELKGMLHGLFAYIRGRIILRDARKATISRMAHAALRVCEEN